MKVLFGCDPNATEMKKTLMQVAEKMGCDVVDMGSDDPIYGNTAITVAEAVAAGTGDRGVLVCGTGLGMSIAANKVKGAYAALLTDVYSAQRRAQQQREYRLHGRVYDRRKAGGGAAQNVFEPQLRPQQLVCAQGRLLPRLRSVALNGHKRSDTRACARPFALL